MLLTLLSLGVKNIRLGPVLPAFLTPEAVSVLVEKFALKPAGVDQRGEAGHGKCPARAGSLVWVRARLSHDLARYSSSFGLPGGFGFG